MKSRIWILFVLLFCVSSLEEEGKEVIELTISKAKITVGEIAKAVYGTLRMWPIISGRNSKNIEFPLTQDSILDIGSKVILLPPEYCVFWMTYECLQVAEYMRQQNMEFNSSTILAENNPDTDHHGRFLLSLQTIDRQIGSVAIIVTTFGFLKSLYNLGTVLATPKIEKLFHYGLSMNLINDSPEILAHISVNMLPGQGDLLDTPFQVGPQERKTVYMSDGGRKYDTNSVEKYVVAGYMTFSLRGDDDASYVFAFRYYPSSGNLQDAADIFDGAFAPIKPNMFPHLKTDLQSEWTQFITNPSTGGSVYTSEAPGWKSFKVANTSDVFDIFVGITGNVATLSIHYYHQHPLNIDSDIYYKIQSLSSEKNIQFAAKANMGRYRLRHFENIAELLSADRDKDNKTDWVIIQYNAMQHGSSSLYEEANPHRAFFIMNRFYGWFLKAISPVEAIMAPLDSEDGKIDQYLWKIKSFLRGAEQVVRMQNLFNKDCFLYADDQSNRVNVAPSAFNDFEEYETASYFKLIQSERRPKILESGKEYRIQRWDVPLMALITSSQKWFIQSPENTTLTGDGWRLTNTSCQQKPAYAFQDVKNNFYLSLQRTFENGEFTTIPIVANDIQEDATRWVLEKGSNYTDNVYYIKNCMHPYYLTAPANSMTFNMNYTLEVNKTIASMHHFIQVSL